MVAMSQCTAQVAVLIVSYKGEPYLADCLDSLPRDPSVHLVVVDNASPDQTAQLITERYPHVHLVQSPTNRGFTGGNNLGWQYVREHLPQVKYLLLLNQDTEVEKDFLPPLVQFLEDRPNVGAVQPMLLLHPQTDQINTAGNQSHFLGFGFKTGSGQSPTSYNQPRQLCFASGAAVLLPMDLLEQAGLFEEAMFLYLEDADLAWKLRQMGYETWLVPQSQVFHKYEFRSTLNAYGYLERNRWWLLLIYYRVATLILLSPALALMELGQWGYAITGGMATAKARSYGFFLKPSTWRLIRRLRREARQRRTLGDNQFMADFSGTIPASELSHWALQKIANPIFGFYWAIARRLMFW